MTQSKEEHCNQNYITTQYTASAARDSGLWLETGKMDSISSNTSSVFSFNASSSIPDFVDLQERHICHLCQKVLKDSVQTRCGHKFCKACLDEYVNNQGNNAECPEDDGDCEPINLKDQGVFNDKCTAKEIRNLLVYCPFKKEGCQVKTPWKNLASHMENCPVSEICERCQKSILKSAGACHMMDECMEAVVECPMKCGEKFKRKEIDTHKSSCKYGPRDCIFKSMGCHFKGHPEELTTHDNEAVTDHMSMMKIFLAKHELEHATLNDKLEESKGQVELLKFKVIKYEKNNDDLKKTVEAQKKTMQNLQKLIANQGAKLITLDKEKASKTDLSNLSASVVNIQQSQQQMTSKMATLGSTGQNGHGNVTRQHEQQLVVHDVRMAEMDLKFQILETTSFDGTLIWKIKNYQKRKQDAINGRTLSLYSQPFFTDRFGYKVCARVYLNGDGIGKGTHLSLFFVVMKGEYDALLPWPFQSKVTLSLMDQTGAGHHISDSFRPDPSSSSYRRPVAEMNVASGCPKFVAQSNLENGSYIKDDTLFIKVKVDNTSPLA